MGAGARARVRVFGFGLGYGLGLRFDAVRPAWASQRGDSGTASSALSCAMHGRTATANILRQ